MERSKAFLNNKIRNALILFVCVTAGLSFFAAAVLFIANAGLFSESRHMQLLTKYDLYSELGSAAGNTARSYISNTMTASVLPYDNKDTMPSFVENAIKPEMMRMNIDNLVTGMLRYFKGDMTFLPDIYLTPLGDEEAEAPVVSDPSAGEAVETSPVLDPLKNMDIDKVNLSAVLMYTGSQDISDVFAVIKLLYTTLERLPVILFLLSFIFLLLAALLHGTKKEYIRASAAAVSVPSALGLLLGCILLYLLKIKLPVIIGSVASALPVSSEIITGYVFDLVLPIILALMLISVPVLFAFEAFKMINKAKHIAGKQTTSLKKESLSEVNVCKTPSSTEMNIRFMAQNIRLFIFTVLTAVLLSSVISKTIVLADTLRENGFMTVYEKFTGTSTYMKVIPAMNDTVYALEVKLLDKSGGIPVEGALIEVEGINVPKDASVGMNKLSGSEGTAKFNIEAGDFTIGFNPEMFPEEYKIPFPMQVSIKSAGTTTVTVNLEKLSSGKPEGLMKTAESEKPVESR